VPYQWHIQRENYKKSQLDLVAFALRSVVLGGLLVVVSRHGRGGLDRPFVGCWRFACWLVELMANGRGRQEQASSEPGAQLFFS
jgi:hypothetical protein